MKRLGALAVAVALLLTGCAAGESGKAPTDNTTTTTVGQPAVDPLTLVSAGRTEYTVVYDDSSDTLTALITDFIQLMNLKLRVTFTAVGAGEAEADYGHEIVIGDVRPSSSAVADRLGASDFAAAINGDDWVLCATSDTMYSYLFAVVSERVFTDLTKGTLTVTAEHDLQYSTSDMADISLAERLLAKSGQLSKAALSTITEVCVYTADDGTELKYRLYVPSDYDPAKQYPVLVYLHGAGDRGNDNEAQLTVVHTMLNVTDTPLLDAILILPQCPEGEQWVDVPWRNGNYSTGMVVESDQLKAVLAVLDQVENTYSTDKNRVYALGVSMGAFGVWDMLARHSERFAAAVPICGAGDPAAAERMKDIPIRTFHGSADDIVPVDGTRAMVAALEAAGSTVIRYEELANRDHLIHGDICRRAEVFTWLFDQHQ